jgi:hypothetical protein
VGAKVLGVVLNRVNLRSADYYQSYRYYGSYYKNDNQTELDHASSEPAPPAPPAPPA